MLVQETVQYIKLFYRTSVNKNILLISVCPTVLKLVLKNAAKDQYSRFEGSYLLSQSKVNGRQYWTQDGKNNAIWYAKDNTWSIGDESKIDTLEALLYNTDSKAPCPQIGKWSFYDFDINAWNTHNSNDIIFSTSGNLLYLKIILNHFCSLCNLDQ